jgi:NAD(P)-dependent dehydrogenase (short-subunit alcohol dehydrogenase family)
VAQQAIRRRVQPEDLAGLVSFLAGDDARMITGQTIVCDGGGYLH